jgi:hypothetical protein
MFRKKEDIKPRLDTVMEKGYSLYQSLIETGTAHEEAIEKFVSQISLELTICEICTGQYRKFCTAYFSDREHHMIEHLIDMHVLSLLSKK